MAEEPEVQEPESEEEHQEHEHQEHPAHPHGAPPGQSGVHPDNPAEADDERGKPDKPDDAPAEEHA